VDFGKVTRLVIQWDVANPNLQSIDEEPAPDKLYNYQYTSFQQPASKIVTVKLMAYSGIVCLGEQTQQITLLGSPAPAIAAIPEVCDNDASFALTQGTDASGLIVTTKYIGAGITGNDVFNPARAGKGLHEILFVSTTTAGCTDTTKGKIIVNESPKVNAGPDRTVLEGTFITLEASSSNVGTVYSWSPSEGLDNSAVLRPSASTKRDILYTLKVESAKGCAGSDQVFVRYLPKLVVPNTFTPNGDGYNDKWEINGILSYLGCVVEIYNTAGTMLFRSQGYGQPWDGTANGKQVPAGTYYYVIDPKNGRPRIAGYVTILR
jgi:gliding motility-associated-like protein